MYHRKCKQTSTQLLNDVNPAVLINKNCKRLNECLIELIKNMQKIQISCFSKLQAVGSLLDLFL